MSFDELYESCFRNASLVKVPLGKPAKEDASLLVTLDHVMNTSQYVVFFHCRRKRRRYEPQA